MAFRSLLCVVMMVFIGLNVLAQNAETETEDRPGQIKETIKLDEFSRLAHCDMAARLDYFLIQLQQNENAKGYIIIYLGDGALPSQQSDRFLDGQKKILKDYVKMRGFDESRIEYIDGGFRKGLYTYFELYLAPPNGAIPQPTETVDAPSVPKNKVYLADDRALYFEEARLPEEEVISEEEPASEVESVESEDESQIPDAEVEPTETVDGENEIEDTEEFPEYEWFSEFFAETLNSERDVRGVIIFYADEEEYDVVKARQLIEDDIIKYAEKLKFDRQRVKLIFGGYRARAKTDFWIVPKGAADPEPEPEIREIKEPAETPAIEKR